MKVSLEIKWPWESIWIEYADDIIAQIKSALPPDHEIQKHDIFPGIKWDRRPKFIVDDDTAGHWVLMDFEKKKRWKTSKYKVPTMRFFASAQELQQRIDQDHVAECAKYNDDGSLKEDPNHASHRTAHPKRVRRR